MMKNGDNSMSVHRLKSKSFVFGAVPCIILGAIGLLVGSSDAIAVAVAASIFLILLSLPRPPYIGPHQ
jgi:hypothetical protein